MGRPEECRGYVPQHRQISRLDLIASCFLLLRHRDHRNTQGLFRDVNSGLLIDHAAVGGPTAIDCHWFPHGVARNVQHGSNRCPLGCVVYVPILFVLCLGFQNVDWYYLLPVIDPEQTLHFLAKPDFLVSLFVYAGGSFFLGLLPPSIYISIKKMMLGCLLLLPMFSYRSICRF